MGFGKLVETYKDWKAALGVIPSIAAGLNNHLHSLIPITPLLRLRATVVTVFACIVAIGCTLSFVHDLEPTGRRGSPRRVAVGSWILGLLSLGLYLFVLSAMEEYPASSRMIVTLLDWVQVALFVLPFGFWTVATIVSVTLARDK